MRTVKGVEDRLPKDKRGDKKSRAVEMQTLCRFIKDHYSSAGAAFDHIFDKQPNDTRLEHESCEAKCKVHRVDQKTFVKCIVAAGYSGNPLLLFELLKDTDEFMTRACFKFRLDGSQQSIGKGQNANITVNGNGDDELPKKVYHYGGGDDTSQLSLRDECRSQGSASTTDTSASKELPKVQSVGINVPELSSPKGLQSTTGISGRAEHHKGCRAGIRRLDLLRPPPLLDLSPRNSVKAASNVVEPTAPSVFRKTPRHQKKTYVHYGFGKRISVF